MSDSQSQKGATLQVRLDGDLKRAARVEAAKNGNSLSEHIRQLIRDNLRGEGEGDD